MSGGPPSPHGGLSGLGIPASNRGLIEISEPNLKIIHDGCWFDVTDFGGEIRLFARRVLI